MKKSDVIKELINDELDIFSLALSRTFDEELSRKRSDRFVLNRICKDVKRNEAIKLDKNNSKQSISNQADKEQKQLINKSKLFEKYKDTALEPYERENKLTALSIDNSLELGNDQKQKDFKIEKLKLESRLKWREIKEFDTDEEDSDSNNEIGDEEDI